MSRKTAEIVRYLAGWTGGLLWMTVSTFPTFGGAAKRAVRCRGRVFDGNFDDCFNDYLPLLEILAPFAALTLLWLFLRFSFTLWAPEVAVRTLGWKLAGKSGRSGYFPLLQMMALAGSAWSM